MCVARAFVQIDVDGHIAFQPRQRRIHCAAIGRGQHRVSRATEQSAHLPFTRRRHLFRHGGHRNFTGEPGQGAHAAVGFATVTR